MTSYQLTIQLSEKTVQQVNKSGKKVAIVKEVRGDGGMPVIWVAFAPFEQTVVRWGDGYSIYAARGALLADHAAGRQRR